MYTRRRTGADVKGYIARDLPWLKLLAAVPQHKRETRRSVNDVIDHCI